MTALSFNSLLLLLEQADKDATLAINALHSPFTDWVWQMFSSKEIWYVLYLGVLFFFFKRLGWKRALVALLCCVLCVVACDQFGNVCKDFFHRLRPCCDASMIERGLRSLEGYGNLYGFYSAHAANTMGFAVCSLRCFRFGRPGLARPRCTPYAVLITLWALLVGASRIFVGKHFLGDVLVGLAVGAFFGWLITFVAGKFLRR